MIGLPLPLRKAAHRHDLCFHSVDRPDGDKALTMIWETTDD